MHRLQIYNTINYFTQKDTFYVVLINNKSDQRTQWDEFKDSGAMCTKKCQFINYIGVKIR